MLTIRHVLVTAITALLLVGCAKAQETMPERDGSAGQDELAAFIDGTAGHYLRATEIPGLTVAVVRAGQDPVLRGYGLADVEAGEAVDPEESLFRIGSVTKTFVWILALKLYDEGRLDLDEDVNTYLETVEIPGGFGAPITMRALMSHRTGLEDSFGVYLEGSSEEARSLAEALARHQPERIDAPGDVPSYSNWGSALAALVLEEITGRPIGRMIREEIFEPLGMTGAVLEDPADMTEAERDALAVGYALDKGDPVSRAYMKIGPFMPAGGAAATARDMAAYMSFLLTGETPSGKRILSEDTHALIGRPAYDDRPLLDTIGHGFFIETVGGTKVIGHDGGTARFITVMMVAPDLGAGVFVSQNGMAGPGAYPRSVTAAIIERMAGPGAAELPSRGGEADSADELAGAYVTNRRMVTSLEKLLAFPTTVTAGEDGAIVISWGSGPRRYRPIAGDVYQSRRGDRVMFEREDGRVVRMVTTGASFSRVGFLAGSSGLFAALGAALFFAATTLFGTWRRWGNMPRGTARGKALGALSIGSALIIAAFAASLLTAVGMISSVDFFEDVVSSYPPPALLLLVVCGWLVAVAAALHLAAEVPVWRSGEWSVWRKMHHTLFTAALLFLTYELWEWRVIGAPYAAA